MVILVGVVAAVSVGGLVTLTVLNLFFWERYNAYGEIPIPGSAAIDLPAGAVTVLGHGLAARDGDTVDLPASPAVAVTLRLG